MQHFYIKVLKDGERFSATGLGVQSSWRRNLSEALADLIGLIAQKEIFENGQQNKETQTEPETRGL